MRHNFLLLLLLIFVGAGCTNEKAIPTPCTGTISYSNDIKQIIDNNCVTCHSAGNTDGDFTTYEGLKLKAESGSLKNRVVVQKNMPPAGSDSAMTSLNIQKINCWLLQGAPNN
jgi:uncharacterized membrane protein